MRGWRAQDAEARAGIARIVRELHAEHSRPSPAAIHEAAHEQIARLVGFGEIHATVDVGGETGHCYYRATIPVSKVDGRPFRNVDAGLRRRARVVMAGYIANSIAEGRAVPDWESLLRAEGPDHGQDRVFGSNPVQPFLAVATKHYNGNVDAACSWLERMFKESRQETIWDLRGNWPKVMKRARELDQRWKRRAAA